MTIVTTNCLNTQLATKQDILKKCDGSPLLANTSVPTCTEFSAVSNNLSSVSAALGGVASSASVAAVSNNLSSVSSSLTNVSATLNTTNIILNSLSSTLANKATYQDVVNGVDDDKILSAKDVYEAYSTGKQIPVNTTKPLNQLGYALVIPVGTTTSDNHYIIAHDLPNTQSASVSSSFYQNFSGQDKSFNHDISGGYGGIGINDVNNTANKIIMTGQGSNGQAIGWQGIIGENVIGNGRTMAIKGINIGRNNAESYGGFFSAYGIKTAGRNIGVYAQAANAPLNTGIIGVAIASTTDPTYRIPARQTGLAGYAEGSSQVNYGSEGYATSPSVGTNHGVFGYATSGYDNKGVEGFAVGETAGTNYGGRFIAQNATTGNYAITGVGNGSITGTMYAQAYVTTSDKRLKDNFKTPKDILSIKVQEYTKKLPQPVLERSEKVETVNDIQFKDGKEVQVKRERKIFDIKEKKDKDGRNELDFSRTVTEIGVLAQDVQAILPHLVSTGENGYLNIDVNSVQFAFIFAIQQKLANLESRIVALEPKTAPTKTAATKTAATTKTTNTPLATITSVK